MNQLQVTAGNILLEHGICMTQSLGYGNQKYITPVVRKCRYNCSVLLTKYCILEGAGANVFFF